jgi:hypothetical protein
MVEPVAEARRWSARLRPPNRARFCRSHDLEAFEEFFRRQAMGDDIAHVEPGSSIAIIS